MCGEGLSTEHKSSIKARSLLVYTHSVYVTTTDTTPEVVILGDEEVSEALVYRVKAFATSSKPCSLSYHIPPSASVDLWIPELRTKTWKYDFPLRI